MHILAHRGYWKDKKEQNTMEAFKRAFDAGFGIELDVRYLYGEAVIEHDCVILPNVPTLKDVLKLRNKRPLTIAINVKEDGLSDLIKKDLEGETDYFCFDMSIPEMVKYLKCGLLCYRHQSDFCVTDIKHDNVSGDWVDSFTGKWTGVGIKPACIVSYELHGRDKTEQWDMLKYQMKHHAGYNISPLSLCTDFPEEADEYFNRQED